VCCTQKEARTGGRRKIKTGYRGKVDKERMNKMYGTWTMAEEEGQNVTAWEERRPSSETSSAEWENFEKTIVLKSSEIRKPRRSRGNRIEGDR